MLFSGCFFQGDVEYTLIGYFEEFSFQAKGFSFKFNRKQFRRLVSLGISIQTIAQDVEVSVNEGGLITWYFTSRRAVNITLGCFCRCQNPGPPQAFQFRKEYRIRRMRQTAMTDAKMIESLLFLRFILWTRELMTGNFWRVLTRRWEMEWKAPRCCVKFSFVAMAIAIWSSIRRSLFLRWSVSFMNSSERRFKPVDPCLLKASMSFFTDPRSSSLCRKAKMLAFVFWNSWE